MNNPVVNNSLISKFPLLANKTVLTTVMVALLVSTETTAQYFIKKSIDPPDNRLFLIGGLLFVLAAYIYRQTIISIGNLSIANIIWQVATILLVTLLSVCVFKETLTLNQWLGIGLVIIGIVLITYETE